MNADKADQNYKDDALGLLICVYPRKSAAKFPVDKRCLT